MMKWLVLTVFFLVGCSSGSSSPTDSNANPPASDLDVIKNATVCNNSDGSGSISTVIVKTSWTRVNLQPVEKFEADVTINGKIEKWTGNDPYDQSTFHLGNRTAKISIDSVATGHWDGVATVQLDNQPAVTIICSPDHTDYAGEAQAHRQLLVSNLWLFESPNYVNAYLYDLNDNGQVIAKLFVQSHPAQGLEYLSQQVGTWTYDGFSLTLSFANGRQVFSKVAFKTDVHEEEILEADLIKADGTAQSWNKMKRPETTYAPSRSSAAPAYLKPVSYSILQFFELNRSMQGSSGRGQYFPYAVTSGVPQFGSAFQANCTADRDSFGASPAKTTYTGEKCVLSPDSYETGSSIYGTEIVLTSMNHIQIADPSITNALDVTGWDLKESSSEKSESPITNDITVTGTINSKALGILQVDYKMMAFNSFYTGCAFAQFKIDLKVSSAKLPPTVISCENHCADPGRTYCTVNGVNIRDDQAPFVDLTL